MLELKATELKFRLKQYKGHLSFARECQQQCRIGTYQYNISFSFSFIISRANWTVIDNRTVMDSQATSSEDYFIKALHLSSLPYKSIFFEKISKTERIVQKFMRKII